MRPFSLSVTIVVVSGMLLVHALSSSAQNLRTGLEQLSEEIIKGVPEGKELRVAVADFPDLLNITSNLGRYIANRLTTRLTQSQKFFVVERQRLEQVLQELRFSMSDLVDPEKAKKLGSLVGVEAIVVGTISDLGNQVDIDARIIEIETSRTVLSSTMTISKDQTVAQLIEQGRTAALPPTAAPPGTPPQPQQSITAARASGSSPAYSQEPSASHFQNSFLRVTHKSSGKADNNKKISVALLFENISEKNLFISIKHEFNNPASASLIDDKGAFFSLERLSGISSTRTHGNSNKDKANYTLFSPGAKNTIVMIFESKEESKGSIFSFSVDFYKYIEDEKEKNSHVDQFSIGIANMSIQ